MARRRQRAINENHIIHCSVGDGMSKTTGHSKTTTSQPGGGAIPTTEKEGLASQATTKTAKANSAVKPGVVKSTASGPPRVELYTDGACSGNPGPGGWAFLLRHPATNKELENSGGEPETTNNRMELTAVVRGLEALKRSSHVTLISDSVYVGKGLVEWMPKWKANGWRRREGKQLKEIKNVDLWRLLDTLLARHQLVFKHVAGHAGHPENERCDELAVAAYQQYLRPRR